MPAKSVYRGAMGAPQKRVIAVRGYNKKRGYRARKVDTIQKEVVDTFVRMGLCVIDLHEVGKGCPDLLVSIGGNPMDPKLQMFSIVGMNVLVEVKTGDGDLTDGQSRLFSEWPGPKAIVRSVNDAEFLATVLRGKYL